VESDGKPHKVTVTHEDLIAQFEYVCVPTKSSNAFLKATATNSSAFQLLKGPMNVFMNNFFIATSSLSATSPQETFRLYLGADAGIKVDFQPVQFNESFQGGMPFSKKTKMDTTTHTTVIKNLKKKKIKVVVFDQRPFSSNSNDIKIKIEEPRNNAPGVTVDDYNLISWDLNLEPDTEMSVVFKYSIEYPVERSISSFEQKGVKGEMRL